MPTINPTWSSTRIARSWAVSPESMLVKDVWDKSVSPQTLSEEVSTTNPSSLEGELHNNKANLKVKTSQIAMHLSSEDRKRVFAAVDYLLDSEDFDSEEDSLINVDSFCTYLRFLTFSRVTAPANLGVDHNGFVLGMWIVKSPLGKKKLSLEFLPDDSIKCSYSYVVGTDLLEATSYVGPVQRIDSVLKPFDIHEIYRHGADEP